MVIHFNTDQGRLSLPNPSRRKQALKAFGRTATIVLVALLVSACGFETLMPRTGPYSFGNPSSRQFRERNTFETELAGSPELWKFRLMTAPLGGR